MNRIFIPLLCFFTSMIEPTHSLSDLSNTAILKNSKKTQAILLQHGFSKVYFTTADKINLCALFLDQSKTSQKPIKGTIIFCAGFYPGTKEGIATFYQMFGHLPYNFLFFDSRGHNESEGYLFTYNNLKQYGSSEYQDIIAAIEFVQHHNVQNNLSSDIILHGMCSGAFHCVKTVSNMQQTNHQNLDTIKGIVFDSGWSSVSQIAEPTLTAQVHHWLKESYFSFLSMPLSWILTSTYQLLFKHHHLTLDSIETSIKHLDCPILFIHSEYDNFAPIAHVKSLAQTAKNSISWWLDIESHATAHLKKMSDYSSKMIDFLTLL